MEICTQDDLHGIRHGGNRQEDDVSHASTIERLGHVHVGNMAFAMQEMTFLCFYTVVENGSYLFFHSSHVSLFFLSRIEKVSHDILGLRIIVNGHFIWLFKISKLSTNISHKFSIIRALTPYIKGLSHFVRVSSLEHLYFEVIYLLAFTFRRSLFPSTHIVPDSSLRLEQVLILFSFIYILISLSI